MRGVQREGGGEQELGVAVLRDAHAVGDAVVHLLRVVAPAEVIPLAAPMPWPTIGPELTEARRARAQEYLECTASRLRATGWHVDHEVVTEWAPSTGVLSSAAARECDLIAIATRGSGGVQRMLLGSVAERVCRLASCPVLTVRHPEREFVRPDTLVPVAREETRT